MPVTIFFCYAREDEALLNKLKAHLRPLQRQGLIDVWHDRDISAGTVWEQEINRHLNAAQIVLLLVSPDFMNSDYCYGIEMKRALERHERGEARVIPIILRPTYWNGKPLGTFQALPKDGRPVTSSSWDDQDAAFYNVTEGISKVVKQLTAFALDWILTGHTEGVTSLALSADGETLISGSADRTIKVWNLSTGKEVRTLTGHTQEIWSLALSADGETLVSGSYDRTIKVWKLSTGKQVRTLTGHTEGISSVALSVDGETLVSGSEDRKIKVWNLSTGTDVQTLADQASSFLRVALSTDGETLVSTSGDHTIEVWRVYAF